GPAPHRSTRPSSTPDGLAPAPDPGAPWRTGPRPAGRGSPAPRGLPWGAVPSPPPRPCRLQAGRVTRLVARPALRARAARAPRAPLLREWYRRRGRDAWSGLRFFRSGLRIGESGAA